MASPKRVLLGISAVHFMYSNTFTVFCYIVFTEKTTCGDFRMKILILENVCQAIRKFPPLFLMLFLLFLIYVYSFPLVCVCVFMCVCVQAIFMCVCACHFCSL